MKKPITWSLALSKKKIVDFENWICLNGKFATPLVILQPLSIPNFPRKNKVFLVPNSSV
jgi:hypothetical protein